MASEISPAQNPGNGSPFDAIKRTDEHGEFWDGRDYMPLLDYDKWERFADVIEKARATIAAAGGDPDTHASRLREASGRTQRGNYRLTRYGCYMVAMSAEGSKPAVANAKTYFAVQTRRAETAVVLPDMETVEGAMAVLDLLRKQIDARVAAENRAAIERVGREIAEDEVRELAPAAESWDRMVNATGDRAVREAAQLLARDPEIKHLKMGQKKLFDLLRDLGWLDKKSMPYQAQINAGRLALRLREWTDRDSGESRIGHQVRVTPKGIHEIRGHLTGAKPLQLRLALVEDALNGEVS